MGAFAAVLASAAATFSASAPPPGISLALPLACEIGVTCFVQHYVDHDPTAGARDYRCGPKTYDGHDGTDIRLPDLEAERAGVKVLAAADGVVLRARDGMADVSISDTGKAAVKDRECGNGMVVTHAGGWETQYCHMKKGSLQVRPGDAVAAGQPLGEVGLSGETEFPHLHLTVRHDGQMVDPFDYGAPLDRCGVEGQSLWTPDVGRALAYRSPEVIISGFAGGPLSMDQVEAGELSHAPPGPNAPALVAFVMAIGLDAGDVQRLVLTSPSGKVLMTDTDDPLDHSKDIFLMFGGARLKLPRWPAGVYRARYTVLRGGVDVLSKTFDLSL